MTEAEQFLTEFLGVQENDFPITLNLRLYGEALEAYVAHVEKKKADIGKFAENTLTGALSVSSSFPLCQICGKLHTTTQFCLGYSSSTNDTQEDYTRHDLTGADDGFDAAIRKSKGKEETKNPVRILVWDWKNNCYETEK